MDNQDFTNYLMGKCMEDSEGVLDDDLYETYLNWLDERTKEELINYADIWKLQSEKYLLEKMIKKISKLEEYNGN